MENDIVLYRYADVLLMKSEAKVRNGENGDEELNLVRSRVNAPFRTATLANLLAERQLSLPSLVAVSSIAYFFIRAPAVFS